MESAGDEAAVAAQQVVIAGAAAAAGAGGHEQPLVMSAEDAARLFQQAGLQWDASGAGSGHVIIGGPTGDVQPQEAEIATTAGAEGEEAMMSIVGAEEAAVTEVGAVAEAQQQAATVTLSDINDGTVLYIDPNDPQAAALLQQAGLALAEDGTVHSIQGVVMDPQQQQQELLMSAEAASAVAAVNAPFEEGFVGEEQMVMQEQQQPDQDEEIVEQKPALLGSELVPQQQQQQHLEPRKQQLQLAAAAAAAASPASSAGASQQPSSTIEVGPDQQQVFYSVTYEDGKVQQYMMLCPKEMDQNALIQTLVKQISADPTAKGKKTIRIQKPISGQKPGCSSGSIGATKQPGGGGGTRAPILGKQPPQPPLLEEVSAAHGVLSLQQQQQVNLVESSEAYESVVPQTDPSAELMTSPEAGGTRVYVRCFYCPTFRSTLNSETWEAILNHVLPVCREELQASFYGDLAKHFVRSVRLQVNGKQVVRSRTTSGSSEIRTPQCEVILTHSLVCRKTKREFLVHKPDATFVANLASHIRTIQPGQGARGNSLLCIFCNSPFTYEDYLRHIQPHVDQIVATLSCFSGAYCAHSYETLIKATATCQVCQEPEPADLRFLPCTKFSQDYRCLAKLQFAIECFRENFGDSGFMRLNTSNLAKCSVCKNNQQVYCAVFHITTTTAAAAVAAEGANNGEADDGDGGTEKNNVVDSQLSVCVNCQKQFINIVMKEQNFEERLKVFQLRNMEQLCSCLRVILGQARQLCEEKRTLLYTVDENSAVSAAAAAAVAAAAAASSSAPAPPSAVHTVKNAEVTALSPITRLAALSEPELARSPVKALFVCDLCLFTVDLTSLISAPAAVQRNEMLLSIVLEHLIPHAESLMAVIASSAANRTVNIKFDVLARVTDIPVAAASSPGGGRMLASSSSAALLRGAVQRKIVLSLQKKFKSQGSNMEVLIERDEEKVMNLLKAGIKAERKQYVSIRPSSAALSSSPDTVSGGGASQNPNAVQLVDVNKFVEQQRGKLAILGQCGCNTGLLNSYTECRLCGKYCFPDFRLTSCAATGGGGSSSSGAAGVASAASPAAAAAAGNAGQQNNNTSMELCENCVETVLTLCLPSEPETLEVPEECLALRQDRAVGHRLVLASSVRKWLSMDAVNAVKKAVDSHDLTSSTAAADCGAYFNEAIKQHLVANLKTCQNDPDITSAVTGFAVTDSFFAAAKVHAEEARADQETAAALASLSAQIGMPIRQAPNNQLHQGAAAGHPSSSMASSYQQQQQQVSGGRPAVVSRQRQIEVKILSRRPPEPPKRPGSLSSGAAGSTASTVSLKAQRLPAAKGLMGSVGLNRSVTQQPASSRSPVAAAAAAGKKVIHVTSGTAAAAAAAAAASATPSDREEESVSAIQSFINATSSSSNSQPTTTTRITTLSGEEVRVPKGVKITSAGKGVVNIRAVADSSVGSAAASPRVGRGAAAPKVAPKVVAGGNAAAVAAAKPSPTAAAKPSPAAAAATTTVTPGGTIIRKTSVVASAVSGADAATSGAKTTSSVKGGAVSKGAEDLEEFGSLSGDDEEMNEQALQELEEAMKDQDHHHHHQTPVKEQEEPKKSTTDSGSASSSSVNGGGGGGAIVNSSSVKKGTPTAAAAKVISLSSLKRTPIRSKADSSTKTEEEAIQSLANATATSAPAPPTATPTTKKPTTATPTTTPSAGAAGGVTPKRTGGAHLKTPTATAVRDPATPTNSDTPADPGSGSSGEPRTKRQRKERKIFDL